MDHFRQIAALEAMISDKSLKSHPRASKSTFTGYDNIGKTTIKTYFPGLDYETLSQITTTEMMQQASLESGKKISLLQKLRNSVVR